MKTQPSNLNKNKPDPFEAIFPSEPIRLNILPSNYTFNGKICKINAGNKYKKHIFTAIFSGLQSDWFLALNKLSIRCFHTCLSSFVPWLNEFKVTNSNRYKIIKNYESKRINNEGLKPQSSGINLVMTLLKAGLTGSHIENETLVYIESLIKMTRPAPFEPPIQPSLSSFFASMPWLRYELGERNWLKLESPKIVADSFSVTVATLLLYAIKIKGEARDKLGRKYLDEVKEARYEQRTTLKQYCRKLCIKLCKFDEMGAPTNPLSEMVITDIITSDKMTLFTERFVKTLKNDNRIKNRIKIDRKNVFGQPNIFSPAAWNVSSKFEQQLFSWLCAWMTVQPSDTYKLRLCDFVVSKNNSGRAVGLQCVYYKSRSNRVLQPFMLGTEQIEAKAIISYLDQFSGEDSCLTPTISNRFINLTFGQNSFTETLARTFKQKQAAKEIESNLFQRKSSPIFMRAYLAMHDKKKFVFRTWINRKKHNKSCDVSINDYYSEVKFPMPTCLFGLSLIKNSSVHSRSDQYREGHLVNQNSHSSETEKKSYLTDANKDWVNQNGRITRMVLDDMENFVYKPNLSLATAQAQNLIIRTKVIHSLGKDMKNSAIKINNLSQINSSHEITVGEPGDILVLDTAETVVNFLHYIYQAELKRHSLVNHALMFFEKTVLPTVEWMESLLMNDLSAPIIHEGKEQYEAVHSILPPLFENELKGGVGI